VCAFGHLGDGNIHFNLSQPVTMQRDEFIGQWQDVTRLVHDLVAEMEGSFSAEHGIGLLRLPDMQRYKDSVTLDLMRRLKTAIDPAGIMNPGKVVAVPAERR
jgi:D-lactate dehydrogenase (cytochrome)